MVRTGDTNGADDPRIRFINRPDLMLAWLTVTIALIRLGADAWNGDLPQGWGILLHGLQSFFYALILVVLPRLLGRLLRRL